MALKKPETNATDFIELAPPPGTRFSIWGSNLRLEFASGKRSETINWLADELGKAEQAKTQAKAEPAKAPAPSGDGSKVA